MAAILWLKLKRMRQEVFLYVIMTFMALFLTFIFGSAMFGGGSAQRLYVADNDGSALSAAFIDAFDTDAYALEEMSEQQAGQAVAKGEALAAIVIPKGFEDSIAGGSAQVSLLRTADSADILALEGAVRSAYQSAVHGFRLHDALAVTLGSAGLVSPSLSDVQENLAAQMEDKPITVNYTVQDADNYDELFSQNIHYMMGFNIFFVMFSIVFTLSSILEDKKLRTWNRIRISPLSTSAVLAGNFIPAYVVGLLQMAIVLFVGQLLFGINLGAALLPVFAVFAVFVLAASCLGLLLAVTFKAYEQMNAAVPVIIVGTSMLGGCMWPLSIVGSDILLAIGKCMPQFWALDAAENLVVMGADFSSVALNLGVLFGMALVLFALSMLIYNKKAKSVIVMDEKILEAAQKYLGLAQDIMTFEATEPFEGGLPIDVQTALLRLYYAKKVDVRIQKCEALLTDETAQSAIDALSAAAEAVDDAALAAMEYIEEYMKDDRDFARMLDKLSMSTQMQGLEGQLCKLYKCESIIKETYDYASAHSYGLTPEEFISERMDVDMDALMELRQSLLTDISKALGETA